jgi:hypothetical protein
MHQNLAYYYNPLGCVTLEIAAGLREEIQQSVNPWVTFLDPRYQWLVTYYSLLVTRYSFQRLLPIKINGAQ